MIPWPNMLLIAGTNRNVGKTTLACQIIQQISHKYHVAAVKFTPHFHELTPNSQLIYQTADLIITRELYDNTGKDSSKMLAAGASVVYYIQTAEAQIPEAINYLKTIISGEMPVVCESAALRNFVMPGKFLLLSGNREPVKNIHFIAQADVHVTDFNFNALIIDFGKKGWNIEKA